MKTSIKNFASFSGIVLFFVLAIASTPSKKGMTIENGQVPPDFKGYAGTLLIISQDKYWNNAAERAFRKRYTGKYLMIDKSELSKYSDLKKYRFALGRTANFDYQTGQVYKMAITSESLCLADRQQSKKYCTKSSSFFGKLLKAYASALENERTR